MYEPQRAGRSFGPGTAATFDAIQRFAASTGLLLDPVYSGKLFLEMESITAAHPDYGGDMVVVHSGGVPAPLMGFAHRLTGASEFSAVHRRKMP